MNLQDKLEKEARVQGATYFGVADLSLARQGVITPNEAKLISRFPRAISIGVALSPAIVDSIEDQSDSFALQNYCYHVYEMVNPFIDILTLRVSQFLMAAGFSAFTIPVTQDKGDAVQEPFYGIFSHKMAANLAGLGWIGKSCMLITPDRGPQVRWGTILTDAPFSPGKPIQGKGCGGCKLCVEECPVGAFTGKPFLPHEPREERMNAGRCMSLLNDREKSIGVYICGLCVFVCPFGQRPRAHGE